MVQICEKNVLLALLLIVLHVVVIIVLVLYESRCQYLYSLPENEHKSCNLCAI